MLLCLHLAGVAKMTWQRNHGLKTQNVSIWQVILKMHTDGALSHTKDGSKPEVVISNILVTPLSELSAIALQRAHIQCNVGVGVSFQRYSCL